MKPEFALSLSFEGIRLLHRAAHGWHLVGEVALDAPDLSAELARLRADAARLESGDALCKILIPGSQVRYMTVKTSGADHEARRTAAAAALEGATPYDVSDLVFDISSTGDDTHVAAVARDTLTEAEAFAIEHGFRPVSFVAAPGDHPFEGEPFFGVTRAAVSLLSPGEQIEPDSMPTKVIEASDAPAETGATIANVFAALADPQETPAPVPDTEPDRYRPETPDETQPEEPAPAPQPDDPEPASTPDEAPDRDPEEVPDRTPEPDQPDGPRERPASEPEPAPQPSDPSPPSTPAEVPAPQAPSEAPPLQTPTEVPQVSARTNLQAEQARLKAGFSTVTRAAKPAGSASGPTGEGSTDPTKADIPAGPTVRPEPIGPEAAFASLRGPAAAPDRDAEDDTKPASAFVLPSLGGASRRAKAADDAARTTSVTVPEPAARPFASRRQKDAGKSASRVEPNLTTAAIASTNAPETPKDPARHVRPGKPEATPVATARTPVEPAQSRPAMSEAERMTVFGARQAEIGGKPRFLGLMLTTALLVFLAGVAAWASVFLDDGLDLSRLFGDREPRISEPAPISTTDGQILPARPRVRAPEATPVIADVPTPKAPTEPETAEPPLPVELAALEPEDIASDAVAPEVLRQPDPPEAPAPLTGAQLEARYAATGIWPLAPQIPPDPASIIDLDDLYLTGIDPVSTSTDAVALPTPESFASDVMMAGLPSPVAAGTQFELDERGLVVPSKAGALTPDGILVYRGPPPAVPPETRERAEEPPALPEAVAALAGSRPKSRPSDLSETNERARNDGLTSVELAGFRPQLRPPSQQQQAAVPTAPALKLDDTDDAVTIALASPPAIQNATEQATVTSRRPDTRPNNFARIVKQAERVEPTRVAAVAPRTVVPKQPTKTSVAAQATVRNAINLRKVNLIGVYGKPSNRRALVRLDNGRYEKVVVGDRIDGGRVSAIGDSELRYRKRGRDVVLTMPKG